MKKVTTERDAVTTVAPPGKLTGEKVWTILDARAWDDPDRASVYEAFSSHKEPADLVTETPAWNGDTLESVKKRRDKEWEDGVIFEYDELLGDDEVTYAINEKLIG
jgi:hypothetical protein